MKEGVEDGTLALHQSIFIGHIQSPDHPCLPHASLLEEGEERGKIADLINKRIVSLLEEEKIARRRKSGED